MFICSIINFLKCFPTLFAVGALPHFSFRRLMCTLDSLGRLCHPSIQHSGGEGMWWRSKYLVYFLVYYCVRYPVVVTYQISLWMVLHNARISRDKKNLNNASLFSLCFVSFAACMPPLCFIMIIITFVVHNKRIMRLKRTNSLQVVITCQKASSAIIAVAR